MGDRANIVIRDVWPKDLGSHEAVFLYSHYEGYELPETLRAALVAGVSRWDDGPCLARIIFDCMTREDDGETTGFGIGTRLGDNEHDLLVLLPAEGRLVRLPERHYRATGFVALEDCESITFEEYVSSEARHWDSLTTVAA